LKRALEKNIHLEAIHLKANLLTDFTALFVGNLKEYVSDEFRDIYVFATELKKETCKETFNIYFSFTHNSPYPCQELLTADGFFLRYEKESGNLKPCTS